MTLVVTKGAVIDLNAMLIVFDRFPTAKIIDPQWVDHNCRDYLKEYFGSFTDLDDLVAQATCHVVSSKEWRAEPAVGRCFYGLIEYADQATVSDLIKRKDLIFSHQASGYTDTARFFGDVKKRHRGYWLSHPVERLSSPAMYDSQSISQQLIT